MDTGRIFGEAGDEIDAELLEVLKEAKVKDFPILDIDHVTIGAYIRNTLHIDKNANREEALLDWIGDRLKLPARRPVPVLHTHE